MPSTSRRLLLLMLSSIACGERASRGGGADAEARAPSSARVDSVRGAEPVPLYMQERRVDLTGDGAPERLTLVTRGTRWDSLDVRLEIRSPDDSLLHARRWSSRWYFHYDPLGGKPDSTVRRIVRGHLERVLADSAFAPPRVIGPRGERVLVDTATIRHDIAEAEWRRANGVSLFDTLPARAFGEIMAPGNAARRVARARVDSIGRELTGRPSFTYFAGGESTTTIAWSPRERRFVRIFECC